MPMQELRFVAVSEDGRYAVLAVPGRSARFTLPIDERLRAVALGQTTRLAQYEIEVESPLRPKEIQARIRAGETVEEIADAAGIAVERVRWFEGPVLAERAYIAQQAQTASVRRQGDSAPAAPGPRLGEIVTEQLAVTGADPDDAQWDARKRGDANWQVRLTFTSGGRVHVAEWVFDPRRRHVLPDDDTAVRMSLPGAELPQPVPHGEATVTPLAPRLGAASSPATSGPGASGPGTSGFSASGLGPSGLGSLGASGGSGVGSSGRSRHERPGPGWPAAPEPAVPAREAVGVPRGPRDDEVPHAPDEERTHEPAAAHAAAAAANDAPAIPAEASTEQAGRQGRKAARGRRSSVPSWDEIMFGNSRQRD
jgi:Protein of unknown function (DUF3071)